ncbi:MAG: hypothetical protein PSX80_13860 [bacterium]|nr:hypothetical protein [bacterium]
MKITHILIVLAVFVGAALGQMRPPETETTTKDVKPAPATVNAQYQGGFFGVSDKESGTLKFDDANERLVFFGEDGKERFGIPYSSVLTVYPDEKSVTTTAGNVVKYIPLPGAGLAGLIREKRRYLILNYDDPDVDAKGTTSFKLANKDILESVIFSIGTKAKMKQRGDAYVRPRVAQADTN